MKLLLSEIQLKTVIQHYLNEDYNNMYDWYEFKDENMREILSSIKDKEFYRLRKIPAMPYKRALEEFVKFRFFNRFPVKYIYQWKNIVLENIATLHNTTQLMGHGNDYPYDEFYDVFDYNYDTGEEYDGEYSKWAKQKAEETGNDKYLERYFYAPLEEYLDDVCHMEDYLPTFSNGAWFLSDFGLKPLFKLGERLIEQDKPEDIIITINKILDITHARSDLAEVFIEGGSKSLDNIAGYERTPEYHGP